MQIIVFYILMNTVCLSIVYNFKDLFVYLIFLLYDIRHSDLYLIYDFTFLIRIFRGNKNIDKPP